MIKLDCRAWGVSVMVCPGFSFKVIIVVAMGEYLYEMLSTAKGRHLVEVLSSITEQEHIIIRKRQREEIDAAKEKGKHLGRPEVCIPENWDAVIEQWKQGKITAKEAMMLTGLKRSSFYKLVKEA